MSRQMTSTAFHKSKTLDNKYVSSLSLLFFALLSAYPQSNHFSSIKLVVVIFFYFELVVVIFSQSVARTRTRT